MVLVAPATSGDVPAMARLFDEMDRFYGATELPSPDERAKDIAAMLFRPMPAAHVLLAWDEEQLVGFAAYSFLWPAAGVTQSLYLKELYVVQAARRRGIGRLLMQHLHRLAVEQDCSRVEWTADVDNVEAQRFYTALGVPAYAGKTFYRVEGEDAVEMVEDEPKARRPDSIS